MSTSEPDPFSARGDEAETEAFRGDGAYSGGDFAGGNPERYDRRSGHTGTDGTAAQNSGVDGESDGEGPEAPNRDVWSRDLQHTSLERNATEIGHSPDRS